MHMKKLLLLLLLSVAFNSYAIENEAFY